MNSKERNEARLIRKGRVRRKILKNSEHPRLTVFRSGKHIYAQIIDDREHKTLASASTMSKELKQDLQKTGDVEAAKKVGQLLAQKAKDLNLETLSFDRNGYIFHGRVKALADAAREAGLKF